MFLTAKFLKLNVFFLNFIQQLMFVLHLCVYAFLDFETKEFITNGKVFCTAILFVVHINLADVATHCIGIAQRNIILNDVRFCILRV